jgi:hypothetical protein
MKTGQTATSLSSETTSISLSVLFLLFFGSLAVNESFPFVGLLLLVWSGNGCVLSICDNVLLC